MGSKMVIEKLKINYKAQK